MGVRKATVTQSGSALSLRMHDSGGGARPVARPFLGGTTTGFHAAPLPGDQVALLQYGMEGRYLAPLATVSATDTPASLPALAAGEAALYAADGRVLVYTRADGTTQIYHKAGGADLSVDASGNLSLGAPAGGTITATGQVLLPRATGADVIVSGAIQQATSAPRWSIDRFGNVVFNGTASIYGKVSLNSNTGAADVAVAGKIQDPSGSLWSIDPSGNVAAAGTLQIGGSAVLGGAGSTVTIPGTLGQATTSPTWSVTSAGAGTFAGLTTGTLTSSGNVSLNGAGNTVTVAGTLAASGATNLTGTLTTTGAVNLSGAANTVTVAGTLAQATTSPTWSVTNAGAGSFASLGATGGGTFGSLAVSGGASFSGTAATVTVAGTIAQATVSPTWKVTNAGAGTFASLGVGSGGIAAAGSSTIAALTATGATAIGTAGSAVVVTASPLTLNAHLHTGNASGATTLTGPAGWTVSLGRGNDVSGEFSVTTNATVASGALFCAILFATAYPDGNFQAFFFPSSSNATALQLYRQSTSGTGVNLYCANTPSPSTTYVLQYLIVH